MVGKKVAVPVSLLKRVVRFALVIDEGWGVEKCLYCSWRVPFVTPEESARLFALSDPERQEWIRQQRAVQQHEQRCVVTQSRKALGLPNPRAVYVPSEKEASDDRD